jgi:hypothetical protein
MKPTEKRTEGAIYNFELREEKNAAKEALRKAKLLHKPVYYLEKDTHTGETIKKIVRWKDEAKSI